MIDIYPVIVDFVRIAHLICFAAGMGTALFFDVHSFLAIGDPIERRTLSDLARVHVWIIAAFAGLWLTGLALIYIRTGFDLTAFSPKLWTKVALMIGMTVNSVVISKVVLGTMRANIGTPLADLPLPLFVTNIQIAAISMFCWTSGVMLGASTVLKAAPWGTLLPLVAGWFIGLSLLTHICALMMRKWSSSKASKPASNSH